MSPGVDRRPVSDPSVADFAFGERRATSPFFQNGEEKKGLTRWEHALRFLPENDLIPLNEARALILSERAQLWCGADCAGVTEVSCDNRLHILLAGGSMSGLLAMRPDVEAFGRALGCRAVFLSGRQGWRRIFPRFGYAFDGEDMVLNL